VQQVVIRQRRLLENAGILQHGQAGVMFLARAQQQHSSSCTSLLSAQPGCQPCAVVPVGHITSPYYGCCKAATLCCLSLPSVRCLFR
jgi:hypothetical protein